MRSTTWWRGTLLVALLGAGGALAQQQQPMPDWRQMTPEEARAAPNPKPPRVTTPLGRCPRRELAHNDQPVPAARPGVAPQAPGHGRTPARQSARPPGGEEPRIIVPPQRVTVEVTPLPAYEGYCERKTPSFGPGVPVRSNFAPELESSTAPLLGR